ncbi:hypothetical protein IL306_005623 [Fusarium sp. DS 682]|nr:hypothetical protein IL306_005623 [Fusarium sp. DS 682]
MATLNVLKKALKEQIKDKTPTIPLSSEQYRDGFDSFVRDAGWKTYQDFIIPQLSQLLSSLTRNELSVLEIGPGPKSVLGYLPAFLRKKITNYTAFEPSELYAKSLDQWLSLTDDESPFPSLKASTLHRKPFRLWHCQGEMYNVILFCHSLYGMNRKEEIIRNSIKLLVEEPDDGMVIMFHRNDSPILLNLVCHRSATYPTGAIVVKDEDEAIDRFAPFIVGSTVRDRTPREAVQPEWRRICRELAGRDKKYPGHLVFSSPELMIALTRHATNLRELTAQVPSGRKPYEVKNRKAQLNNPVAIVRPVDISQVQECVQWALRNKTSLAILGGGHSGHCLWPSIVSVDMSAFNKVHVVDPPRDAETYCWVVAEAGCKTGDIIREAMSAGVTVPLGSRPSVGAGLWLQGGIGHLARLYGLACDAILGAVMVSVSTGQVFLIGHVPEQLQPPDAIRPEDEGGLLWALKGAGTNFGIVISVTFKAETAQLFSIDDSIFRLRDDSHAQGMLITFGSGPFNRLRHDCSTDVYLYHDGGQMHLGATSFRCAPWKDMFASSTSSKSKTPLRIVNAVELFDTEMYVSKMHGGHGGGKTSSFKRCVFLKDIDKTDATKVLVAALKECPTPYCYFHLLNGGEAVRRQASGTSAFGCRDWDLACVITGVWLRDEDGTPTADAVVRWVYQVVHELLPMSQGVYGADLGPDPRDKVLATKAFGPNRRRLIQLKKTFDPNNVLAYACPLTPSDLPQKLIVLVTGEHGAGKDYCAGIWVNVLKAHGYSSRVDSISEVTKRQYAAAKDADFNRLLSDRAYKEKHRKSVNDFYEHQLKTRPRLAEEHFLEVLNGDDVDVLFITGMREEAPVVTLSHLVRGARLLDVRVQVSEAKQSLRRWGTDVNPEVGGEKSKFADTNYLPSFTFDNELDGDDASIAFANRRLIPFMSDRLQSLTGMVTSVQDFPRQDIEFRHVLNIAQQKVGLGVCISLMKRHLSGESDNVNAIVTCEASGYIFASSFAMAMNLPLILIGKGNKLPPPKVSVNRCPSHISSRTPNATHKGRFEMDANAIRKGDSVLVVDDVLATGETLVAVLKLLTKAGVQAEDIGVMVVAELPVHRGREKLRENGFGRVAVQSLLVFDGQ